MLYAEACSDLTLHVCFRMLDEKEQRMTDSSLAQLLKTDQVVSRIYNDHGGGLVNPVQVLGQIPRKSKYYEESSSPRYSGTSIIRFNSTTNSLYRGRFKTKLFEAFVKLRAYSNVHS